jgi:hypothetical protein
VRQTLKAGQGFEQRPYLQAEYLKKLFQGAQSVSAQEVIAKLPAPSTGPQIKEAIQKARISAIQQVKADENAVDPKQ